MKKKNKHAILKRKKEFRYKDIQVKGNEIKGIKIRHPAYIFLEKGNTYTYVTITHSGKIAGLTLIQLKKNPSPNDSSSAYYVAEIKVDTKDKFSRRLEGWKIDDEDDKEIRNLYEKKK